MGGVDGHRVDTLGHECLDTLFEVGTHAPLGEYDQPMAAGKNISGFFITNGNIYWNIQKK